MDTDVKMGDTKYINKRKVIFAQCPICKQTRWTICKPHRIGTDYLCKTCNINNQRKKNFYKEF